MSEAPDLHRTGEPDDPWATHTVFNQVPALEGENLYTSDIALRQAVDTFGGNWARGTLGVYGGLAGGPLWRTGFDANHYPPELDMYDRIGNRVDQVRFHPAYHQIMNIAIGHGLHSLPWRQPGQGAHVARSALMYLHCQAEAGTMCPVTMTHASIPALRLTPVLAERWEPGILANAYDARCIPPETKQGLTIGMGMTEKQGGSDVRANTSRAAPERRSRTGSQATNGSSRHRCQTPFWCSRTPMSDSVVS